MGTDSKPVLLLLFFKVKCLKGKCVTAGSCSFVQGVNDCILIAIQGLEVDSLVCGINETEEGQEASTAESAGTLSCQRLQR